jgi:hypothetical protein
VERLARCKSGVFERREKRSNRAQFFNFKFVRPFEKDFKPQCGNEAAVARNYWTRKFQTSDVLLCLGMGSRMRGKNGAKKSNSNICMKPRGK